MNKKWRAIIQGYQQAVVFAEIHKEDTGEFTIVIKDQTKCVDLVWFEHRHKCKTLEKCKEKVRKFFENELKGIKGKPWKAWHWEER